MSLLITGGLGFLGQQAARHFLRCGVWSPALRTVVPLRTLTLFDVGLPPPGTLREEITSDDRVRVVTGDLSDKGVPAELIDEEDMSVIHLASMVSGDTEEDPDMGWRTNVEGQRLLLEAIKEKAPGARFLFTSSTAALGPVAEGAPDPDDTTKLLPQNTYGFHKAVCELMLNDYSRRGWVDGRCLRLPVVVVRPGAPNAALTGAWSSVVREPLNGERCALPVPYDHRMPCASYQTVVAGMEVALNGVEAEELGADRALMLPSVSVSCRELHDAAAALSAAHAASHCLPPLGAVAEDEQELASRIVRGMGSRTDGARAVALGLPRDESAESIVAAYAADYVLPQAAAARAPE